MPNAAHLNGPLRKEKAVIALRYVNLVAASVIVAGCASKPMYTKETFAEQTPFSQKVKGSGEVVCWSVKRAFLTQGYMLEHSSDPVIVTGTKEVQKDDKTNEAVRLQATCVDDHDGTSTVFANALYEVSELQRAPQSVSAGVSIATITIPTGSETAMRLQRRETITDPKFYARFYALVQEFSAEEARSASQGRASR